MPQTFWDYAKNLNKVASLEDVFSDWATKNRFDVKTAQKEWESINSDIRTIFSEMTSGTQQGLSIAEPTLAPNAGLATSVEDTNNENDPTLIKGILTS